MTTLFLDLETYSETPIRNGTYAYAERAEVMLWAWALDDGPVSVWDLTTSPAPPTPLLLALEDGRVEIWAHNAQFDRTVLRLAAPFQGARIAAQDISRWRDTRAKALCHGLPGELAALCSILDVPVDQAKDKAGRQHMLLFCKPRADGTRATARTHPVEWQRFVEYAGRDIVAMRAVDAKLPQWNYRGAELALWHLDQVINDRGVAVDIALAEAAVAAVAAAQKVLAKRTQALTAGDVTSATQRDAMLAHILAEYGVGLPDLRADTVERRAADPDLPPELRELLALRLQASTTSAAKYATLLRGVSSDGRLRGALQYSGAQRTRRWSGRLFQPQNMPRESMPRADIEQGIVALKAGCADLVTDNVMALASNAVRGCLVAPAGRKLVVADLANIEGRVAAWLGGEQWKLDAFARYDAGEGPDLYVVAYARAFAVPPESVGKAERQIGKVMELMLQYEGGVGAFVTGAATYGVDLDELAERAWGSLPAQVREEATEFLAWCRREKRSTYGLSDGAFIVCDALKRMWRAQHEGIVGLWGDLRSAAINATQWPGQTYRAGPRRVDADGKTRAAFAVRRDGNWLRILLPSGNYLCYPAPEVRDGALAYMGVDQYSRKWSRLATYGGKLFENACQSLARDVLAGAMPHIEAAGYEIVLTVHDEVICEAPDTDDYSVAGLSALLAANPPWASGLPLAADGFEAHRYRKG